MISDFAQFMIGALRSAWDMLNGSSGWMMFSFMLAGLLHEFMKPEKIQKTAIGSKKSPGRVLGDAVRERLFPICSCGTIPLGISLYYSGAYLGPTLAFMISNPVLNPAALILCVGLLGKEITIIYVITGIVVPMIIGVIANRFAGDELHIRMKKKEEREISLAGEEEEISSSAIQLEFEEPGFLDKIKAGLRWSFTELSVMVSKYTVTGMLVAALLFNIVPQSFIQDYLGNPGYVSLFGITIVAALMYVCAVGHIPFIAALVASGAAPGVAITFLMAGAGTNIPELLTIHKTIGKRAMWMYFGMVLVLSNTVGYITNRLLMPDWKPVLDYDTAQHTISYANQMTLSLPEWAQSICSAVLVLYAGYALVKWVKKGTVRETQ